MLPLEVCSAEKYEEREKKRGGAFHMIVTWSFGSCWGEGKEEMWLAGAS